MNPKAEPVNSRWKSERGAILVFTGLALLAFVGFLVFVIDQGMLLVARGQLQNAADAGALAGAISRTFDNPTGPFDDTVDSATQAALANPVFVAGTTGVVVDPDLDPCPVNGAVNDAGSCVRVDVHRDGTNLSDPLPVVFGAVLNIASQRARATATAQAANANATPCFKPFLIPDWRNLGQFDPATNVYAPPTSAGPGIGGYTTSDLNLAPTELRRAIPGDPAENEHYLVGGNAADLLASIEGCQLTQMVGGTMDQLPGANPADISAGIATLTQNGPVRIVIGLYDPQLYATNPAAPLSVVNLIGFEVSDIDGSGSLIGRFAGASGELRPGVATPGGTAGLIRAIRLLR